MARWFCVVKKEKNGGARRECGRVDSVVKKS